MWIKLTKLLGSGFKEVLLWIYKSFSQLKARAFFAFFKINYTKLNMILNFFTKAIDKMKNRSILKMEVVLQWGMQNFWKDY